MGFFFNPFRFRVVRVFRGSNCFFKVQWYFSAKRRSTLPTGSESQHLHQVTDLVVDLARIGHGVGHHGPQ